MTLFSNIKISHPKRLAKMCKQGKIKATNTLIEYNNMLLQNCMYEFLQTESLWIPHVKFP